MKIGVFDSGLGGVIITQGLSGSLLHDEFVVISDSANFPYGTKSDEELKGIIGDNIDFLERLNVDVVVVACNTASSVIDRYGVTSRIPIITIVDLTVQYALGFREITDFLVLATTSTVKSGIYESKLSINGSEVLSRDCQQLVSLVEFGGHESDVSNRVVAECLEGLEKFACRDDVGIILGCTHFILLERTIQSIFPRSRIINPILPLQKRVIEVAEPFRRSEEMSSCKGISILFTGENSSSEKKVKELVKGARVARVSVGTRSGVHA